MPTSTTNYGLIKPGTDDPILVGQLNDNMDTIDTVLKDHSDKIDAAALGIKYKGEVNYYADLPSNAEIGDAYTVKYAGSSGTTPDGTEYVWGTVSGTNQWINFSKDSYTKAEVDALLALKQNALTTEQLTAVNSGIDSVKVEQIETNKNNILLIEQYDNELSYTGKNLYNYKDVTEGYYINSSGKLVANNALYTSSLIPVKANQSYTISSTSSNTFLYVAVYGTTLAYTQLNGSQTYNGFTFTPTEDCYMRFSGVTNAKTTVQVEIGNSKTTFEKYTRYIKSDIDISEAQNSSPLSEYSYIKNGELVCNNDHINNSFVVAKYNQVDMGNNITKIMAKIKINDASSTGVAKAALIIGNNDTGHGISDITNKSIHVVFTRVKVQVGVFNNGTLSSEDITYSAWTDGSTYEIGYELKGNDTLKVYLPDGTSSDITLQGVDLNQGQYAIYQQYNESVVATNPPTTNTPQVIYKGFYCECQGGLPFKDNFNRPNGGLTVSPTGHTYKQFRNVSTTDTDYDNTN